MKEENEQGFLSHKFDDWSSEPIPNGWSKIQSVLEADTQKNRRAPFWLFLGLAIMAISSLILLNQSDRITTGVGNATEMAISDRGIEATEKTSNIETQVLPDLKIENEPIAETPRVNGTSQLQNSNGADQNQTKNKTEVELENRAVLSATSSETTIKSAGSRNSPLLVTSATTEKFVANIKNLELPEESRETGKLNLKSTTQTTASPIVLPSETSENEIVNSVRLEVQENKAIEKETRTATAKVLNSNDSGSPSSTLENLEGRLVALIIPEQREEPSIIPVLVENRYPISKEANKWIFSLGISAGYAPRSIEINQSLAINRLSMSNQNGGSPSLFGNFGFTIQNEIKPWLRSFGAVKFGMMRNVMAVTETEKSPSDFTMTTSDSINYSMTPVWSSESGTIRQDLLFSTLEFGLNPILIPSRQSGPFASVVVWISLFQKVSSDLGQSLASFADSEENVALSYRLGYQHVFSGYLRGEVFTAGMPDKILANSKGLSVKPQLIGLGLHYIFH